jgi:hypothetical protein
MNYQRRKPNSTPPNRERARELDLAETKTTQQGRQKKREWQAGRQAGRQRRAPRSSKRRRKQKIKVRSCEPHCAQTTKRATRAREPKNAGRIVATAAAKGTDFIAEELYGRTARTRIFLVTSKASERCRFVGSTTPSSTLPFCCPLLDSEVAQERKQ